MNNIKTHGGKRPNAGRPTSDKPKNDSIRLRIDEETAEMLENVNKSFLLNNGMEIMLPYLGKWNIKQKKWEPFNMQGTDTCLIAYNANSLATQMLEQRRDKNGIEADEAWTEEEKSLHALLSKQWDELRAHKTFWEPEIIIPLSSTKQPEEE